MFERGVVHECLICGREVVFVYLCVCGRWPMCL